ncbi:MAG: GMC family oxidoreductase N-terminal domain-containing protein [Streptosporangiaceae bacterium]
MRELEPYYDRAEIKMGVSHRHGRPPLPGNNNYKVFANGAEKVGYREYATGPYATNAEPYDGRPASIQDGFNFQGDKQGSKWSTRVAELPKAAKTGNLDLRPDSHAVRVIHDNRGRAMGVLYADRNGTLRRQRARVVCIAGNSIESPRLTVALGLRPVPGRVGQFVRAGQRFKII